MRILVTGSRNWANERFICEKLNPFRTDPRQKPSQSVLVSGACPTGADRIAEEYAHNVGWIVETHPADWNKYGKKAGYIRNREMVDLGADICLAFVLDRSKGATMTVNMARRAGIFTYVYMIYSDMPDRVF